MVEIPWNLVLIVFFVLLVFHIVTRYSKKARILNKIPGPRGYPIIGSLLLFNTSCSHQFWKTARSIIRVYQPLSKFWGCYDAVVNVYHPDDLEVILSSQKDIEKGYVYLFLQPWLKTGLLTSTGEKWRQRRKILTPAFHFEILKKYIRITSEQGEKFVQSLKDEGDEVVKSLIPLCSNYTLNIICESTLGVAMDKMDIKTVNSYKKAVHDMGKIAVHRLIRPYIFDWMMPYIPTLGSMQKNALKVLHGFSEQVIQERREYHKSTGNKYLNEDPDTKDNDDADDVGLKRRQAMLDLLLTFEKSGLIDHEGIREEVDTFTFEGHDTSAMAMTFTLLLLAENKEAQERARMEVTEVLDKCSGEVGIQEIQKLNYLERCIKESIRLFPPVPTLVRYTSGEALQLKHGLLPGYAHVMIHLFDTHRDPNFWPNPDRFDPDRFLPENTRDRHPFAYVPFSAGPRNCIGQKFAMLELKSLIGRLLYDFYLEPIDRTCDMRLTADLVLRTLDPVHVKFVRRNRS